MIRLAATVMLVRPASGQGFEVLMVRRSGASHFVPHAYVFPGGTVDSADYGRQTAGRMYGLDDEALRAQFRMDDPVTAGDRRALAAAALRELFEEAGVLLACDASGRQLALDVEISRRAFLETLEDEDAYADVRRIELFSQWITPPLYPKRYNTHFFVAVAGADQRASADAVETHDGVWVEPRRALAEAAEGRFSLVYPTIKHLERLAAFGSCDALLDFARTKTIRMVMPDTPAEHHFSMPADLETSW